MKELGRWGETGPEAKAETTPRLYADGHPLDEIHYIEAKIILNGNRFTSVKNFFDFAKIVRKVAKEQGVDFDSTEVEGMRPQIREVLFLDTKDFKLYNNAFILRRRINYEDGFPVGDPRWCSSSAIPTLRRRPVRRASADPRRIPHQVQGRAAAAEGPHRRHPHPLLAQCRVQVPAVNLMEDPSSSDYLTRVFPALAPVFAGSKERISLVNHTAVEEVLQQLGTLDFGRASSPPATWPSGARAATSTNWWASSPIRPAWSAAPP